MPGGSRNRTNSWWGINTPSTGPTGTTGTWRGIQFDPLVDGRIFGFRYYSVANDSNVHLAALTDATIGENTILTARAFPLPPGNESARWRNVWLHPTYRIIPNEGYRLWILYPKGQYFRTPNVLSGGVTQIDITVGFGIVASGLNLQTATVTHSFDAYGADILFRPDNYTPIPYP